MPTRSGKPQVGEIVVHVKSGKRFEVLERSSGASQSYSVKTIQILENGHRIGRAEWMAEFGYWIDRGEYKIEVGAGLPLQGSDEMRVARSLTDEALAARIDSIRTQPRSFDKQEKAMFLMEAARRLRWGTMREKEATDAQS